MRHRILLFALICTVVIGQAFFMAAQTETLRPQSAAGAAVGKSRHVEETLALIDQVVARDQHTAEEVRGIVDRASRLLPGHNLVNVTTRHADGRVFYSSTQFNLRTNAGANWQADIMANTSTPAVNAQCNYIAVTNDSGAASASDTTLASEIAANGLSRAQATYAHTSNATSYTLAKTFTASGTQASQKTGIFTASSSGTMCFEALYSGGAVTVNNTDTLTVTWTINF